MTEYARAKMLAEQLKAELSPVCERIEIAGGVRREKQDCHDIELVATPKLEPAVDMFGAPIGDYNLLNKFISEHYTVEKGGDRYKKILYAADISCDLFIVLPPAQWGVIFTIRTGNADFSHRIVTQRTYGGNMPSDCHVKDGAVWDAHGNMIPMPEEMDFLNFLKLGWIEPKERQ